MQRLALPSGADLTPDDCYAIDVVPQLCGEVLRPHQAAD